MVQSDRIKAVNYLSNIWKPTLLLATLMIVFTTGIIGFAIKHHYHSSRLNKLIAIIGHQRFVEARLTGDFNYGDYRPNRPAVTEHSNHKQKFSIMENEAYEISASNIDIDLTFTSTTRGDRETFFAGYHNYFANYLIDQQKPLANRGEVHYRGNSDLLINNSPAYLEVTTDIFTSATTSPSLESLQTLAYVYLYEGKYDLAIKTLEDALTIAPNNANIFNNLAAAYLEYFQVNNNPQDLINALSFIDKAYKQDSASKEIIFNRALILEKLFLLPTAQQEWQRYLQLEKDALWQQEALNHIKKITAPTYVSLWPQERTKLINAINSNDLTNAQKIIEEYPHLTRIYAIDEALPVWVNTYLNNNFDEATKQLNIMRFIGAILINLQNDHLIGDIVTNLDTTIKQNDKDKIKKLVLAYKSFCDGEKQFEAAEVVNSKQLLLNATKLFIALGDQPGESLSSLYLSHCYRYILQFEDAQKFLLKAINISQERNYPYIEGHCWQNYAQIQTVLFEPPKAIKSLKLAETLFINIKDYNGLLHSNTFLGLIYDQIGQPDKVLQQQYTGLCNLNKVNASAHHMSMLNCIANQLSNNGNKDISLYFLDESIQAAKESNVSVNMNAVYFSRSQAYFSLGNKQAAFEDLARAKELMNNTSDKLVKDTLKQMIAYIEGDFLLNDDPQQAIKLYTEALAKRFTDAERYESIHIYNSRARAYRLIGDYDKAEADLTVSINQFEAVRSKLPFESDRVDFFEKAQSVYDYMIEVQAMLRNNAEKAFYYSEAKRARALLDGIASSKKVVGRKGDPDLIIKATAKPLSIPSIQAQLPNNTSVVEYKLLDKQLLIWIIQNNKFKMISLTVDHNAINNNINAFHKAIIDNATKDQLKRLSAPLYNTLIKPIINEISNTDNIVIIPDLALNDIPFNALINPNTDQYLIEQFIISNCPSATIYINCLKRDQAIGKLISPSILLIGNPAFDQNEFPNLANLKYAEQEVIDIAKLYSSSSSLLIGPNATKQAFLDVVENYNIIHFAGHALVNQNSPLFSQLVLASGSNEKNGELNAFELYRLNFSHTKLVMLAACNTAKGQIFKSEGVENIARPFLAGGVPTVIATLWNADDQTTRRLSYLFYRQINAGDNFALALRNAQLTMINDNTNPALQTPNRWALFILIGGTTTDKN